MNPIVSYELAKMKMAEQHAYADRQRLARQAVSERPRAIDIASLGEKLRVRLFGGPTLGRRSAGGAEA